jgi:Flagellar biosynthesis regulator FlbT
VALNISLKPRERLVVNGAVIRNRSSRHSLTIEFLNRVNFMREREILLPEQAVTPLLRVIYWLQLTYIDPDQRDMAQRRFLELAHDLYDAVGVPAIRTALTNATELMQAGRFGASLKALREVLPLERALLDLSADTPTEADASEVAAAIRGREPNWVGLETSVVEEPVSARA